MGMEQPMTDLPPFLYRTYRQNLHRVTTKTRKDRELHKLERALYFWPMWVWVYMRGRRLKPEQTIEPATAGFLLPENEDSWPLT